MRTLFILIVVVLTALSFRSTFAEATPNTKSATGQIVVAARPGASIESLESLTGEVVSINQEAKRLTVKQSGWFTSKQMTFTVAEQATPVLAELQPGDDVRVGYFEMDEQLIASVISRVPGDG